MSLPCTTTTWLFVSVQFVFWTILSLNHFHVTKPRKNSWRRTIIFQSRGIPLLLYTFVTDQLLLLFYIHSTRVQTKALNTARIHGTMIVSLVRSISEWNRNSTCWVDGRQPSSTISVDMFACKYAPRDSLHETPTQRFALSGHRSLGIGRLNKTRTFARDRRRCLSCGCVTKGFI